MKPASASINNRSLGLGLYQQMGGQDSVYGKKTMDSTLLKTMDRTRFMARSQWTELCLWQQNSGHNLVYVNKMVEGLSLLLRLSPCRRLGHVSHPVREPASERRMSAVRSFLCH